MKKKNWLILFVAFLLLTTQAQLVSALAPVAEVYYNPGASTYNSSNFEAKLTAAIKTKLTAAGINPKYASIMDASANKASVTDATYVHQGNDSWYGFGFTPEVVTADESHVQLLNEGKTVAFYGYTKPGYNDFMLTSGNPTGKKIITFDMDESKVDYHSMEGGGFLFNSKIDATGKLSGNAILYVSNGIRVFRIDNVDANMFHNETNYASLDLIPGVKLLKSFTKSDNAQQHAIKIIATYEELNMWDNGAHIIENLDLKKDVTNAPVTPITGEEFGPIVSHINHGCQIISIFTYDNMKLYSTSSKEIGEAAEEIIWESTSPYRYVVDFNDDQDDYLDGGTNQEDLTESLNDNSAYYFGVTDSVYNAVYNPNTIPFLGGLNPGGILVNSSQSEDDIINQIATKIADDIISKKPAIDAIEAAEAITEIEYTPGDTKNSVKNNVILKNSDNVTTVWSSDQPTIIKPDGTVTRPFNSQGGTYVTLKATITQDALVSEKTFTVFVPAVALSAEAGDEKVTLNFPAKTGASSVVVEVSTDGITFVPATTTETLDATSTSATVTGLTNGTTYYFQLKVVGGTSAGTSDEVQATPSKPVSDLTATAGNSKVTLNFPALTGADDEDIVVEVSTDGTTFTPATTTAALDATSTSATVDNLTNGTTYYFRLNVDSGARAGLSNVVEVKPRAPSAPPVETMDTKVTVTHKSNGEEVVQDKITKIVGEDLKVSGKILSADGKVLDLPAIEMNADGSFKLPKLPTGEYTVSLNVFAPNGEKLAGPVGKLKVDGSGVASMEVELVDPYGTIVDTLTGQPLKDATMKLYWADTELNRSKGKVPGTLVELPELPKFPPNKNHNPQISTETGEYGWMVFADGDYYFTSEKDGYVIFDSRNDTREEKFGPDSYIRNGVIHVGQTIVQFSFPLQAKVVSSGEHSPYMLGYPDGNFHPEYGITRAEVAAILQRLYAAGKTATASYADVNAKHWASEAIAVATRNGWMIGTGNDKFEPSRKVTRAEFAQILLNLNKWKTAGASGYSDTAGHWADKAIGAAKQEGLLFDFTEDTFSPNQAQTRLEAIRIFNKMLNRQPWEVSVAQRWKDVAGGNEHYADIMEASVPHAYDLYTNGYEAWKDAPQGQ
ncbi:S-layer homology domain-containing protein [Cohnella sp. GCM10027633]|uniref:S-layer homology domain-containing protein n=1 Tax=unclassified Cohnella TaxID=2636738 RepID=UPI003641E553